MKNLILFLVLFIPLTMIAQNKGESSNASGNDETDVWMTKISSNSELRGNIISMMIDQTKGNEEEMQKIINSLLADPDMNKLITQTTIKRANNETVYVEPSMMVSDS
ncbi:MAG: hypothetical protein PVF17_01615, partial [Ignavibacteria bacterium]